MSEAATATVAGESAPSRSNTPSWRKDMAPYAQSHLGRSILDVATSVVPYIALSVAMYQLLDVSYWLVLAVAIPAAGFLLRTFILFHDCTHGSFWKTKRANAWWGMFFGLLVYAPFHSWRHEHAVHHATAGDLDRRGVGDVETQTISEYFSKSRGGRFAYRAFRNPLVMFGLGPIWALVIQPRLVPKDARPRIKRSVLVTNLVIVAAIFGISVAIGWTEFLLVQAPTAWLAGSAGVFLFYVQHQFEDVYWENADNWSYADAALRGSSYLKMPKVLQYFTGNIGLHHVHHLSARIPNYNLQRAHDDNPELFRDVPTISIWDGLRATRLKLVDESTGRLVTFAQARAMMADGKASAPTQVGSPASSST
jgi:omega-6 fatty acid desaturase (delta-12 desaturase)